ncbi:MAG: GNAT family N-acetyltransferase [Candidatus Hodarchaeota archaeon]
MTKKLLDLPRKIETERLILRKYKEGDGAALFNLLESHGNRYYLRDHIDEATDVKTEEEAEIRIRQYVADWIAQKKFIIGIWNKTLGLYIGQIWIRPSKWEVPSFELGWFLGQTHQGQGFAYEAVKAALQFLFNHLRAHKVIVLTRDDNVKSYKLAERCGFVKEGHLRDHNIRDGQRFGLFCYGMLKSDYQRQMS